MRATATANKIRGLLEELGRRVNGEGSVYLVGGASALLVGWRDTTVDVDMKLEPEPAGAFAAIAELKNELEINVELASPDQFLPPLPEWQDRSVFIGRYGKINFYHYDFRAQALAKIARGHDRDLNDVDAMLERKLVSVDELRRVFLVIEPDLIRYPAIDAAALRDRVDQFLAQRDAGDDS